MFATIQCVNYRSNKVKVANNGNISRGTAQISVFNLINYTKDIFYPDNDPDNLSFHKVNPRKPVRNKKRLSKTKVVESIKETILRNPDEFILRNRGIDIAVSGVSQPRILNGGNT